MTKKIVSSFRGYFDELPGIYADNFENADQQSARAYFLSHYHADHIQGLYSEELLTALTENGVKIYTTELTAAIISHNRVDDKLMEYVKVLEMGSTLITIPGFPRKNQPELHLTVTLIPAGHCAGSTMFLFKTKTKNILYTGDFRVNPNDLPKYKLLHENDDIIKLDALYIDTTFLNALHDNFPKRSESVEIAVCKIKKWLTCETNAVGLHTSASYGYEFVFNEIYKSLGIKVCVDETKWNLYSKIPHLVPGVTDEETRIHLCSKRSENSPHDSCTKKQYKNYLYIHLSAWKWGYRDTLTPVDSVSPKRIDVCFATHCSKSELKYFVDYFAPNKVFGFPYPYKMKSVSPNPVKKVKIEKVVTDKKVDENLLKLMFG